MKKLIIAATIFGILGMALLPAVAAAQETPNDCCRLSHSITIDNWTGNDGQLVGPSDSTSCDLNNDGSQDTIPATNQRTDWGLVCMLDSVMTVTDWIFYILLLVAVLMVIIGGFTFVTAAGDPEKASSGRRILTFAVIGIAIAVLARLIPSVVRAVVGL